MQPAHIYIRFSHLDQKEGSSTARQRADCLRHCADKGWDVASIIVDEGKSAFSGKNRLEGSALYRFEREAEAGDHHGEILLVERLDRLSRQGYDDTYDFLRKMMRLGVSVATVDGSAFYEQGTKLELIQIITMLVRAETAAEESIKKADRIKKQHALRRVRAVESGTALSKLGPAWLVVKKGVYHPIKEKVELLERIYRMADDGDGSITIARKLNEEGIPVWTRFATRPVHGWDRTRIRKLLTDPAVIGWYQPHEMINGKRTPMGEAIKLYPPAIPADLYERVREASGPRERAKGGGKSTVVANLFSALARCSKCGTSMMYVRHQTEGARYITKPAGNVAYLKHDAASLQCRAAHHGSCTNKAMIAYHGLEKALLDSRLHAALDDRAFARDDEAARLSRELADRKQDHEQAVKNAKALFEAWAEKQSPMRKQLAEAAEEKAEALAMECEALAKARGRAAGQATSEEHLSRVAQVRQHLYDPDLEVRATHRKKVMQGLHTVIETMECDETKTVTVVFKGSQSPIQIRGGKVIADARITLPDVSVTDAATAKIAATVAERMGKDQPTIAVPDRDDIKAMVERRVWTAG